LQCDSAGAAKSDRQARPQKLGHRSMLPERTTKIAVQKDAADPSRILFPHRPVEAERVNQLVARELVGADIVLREHHIDNATRHETHDNEDNQAGEKSAGMSARSRRAR